MIQISELRIGSWVDYTGREGYGKVLSINAEAIQDNVYLECSESFEWAEWQRLTPVPLTPAILVACGFVRNDALSNSSENYEFPERMGLFFLSKTVTAVNEIVYYNLSFPGSHGSCYVPNFNQCKYLHQLQNLVFALTGKEITVNL